MSVAVTARERGGKELNAALRRLSPSENPEILRRAYREKIGPRLVLGIQGFMAGPRPARLDRVSGALSESVTFSVRGQVLEAGVPDRLHWYDLHEFGSVGGRKQGKRRKTLTRGYPARPAVGPGTEEAIASGDLARAQFPRLRAGAAGFERGVRPVETMLASELPHVFAHNPQERVAKLDHGQEASEFSVVLLYVPEHGTSQEDVATLLDLFRAAVQANPTLTSTVEKCFVRDRGVRENPENSAVRAGVLEIVAEWVR